MIEPQITVIIPTRERCDVLEKSLRTVTTQDYNNLEIIVSDNFSGDNTADIVRSANDSRIKYINTGKRVSMSSNWEFALSHVDDASWVTILGDDDGLLPNSLNRVAEIIQLTDVKAIRTSVCSYEWPSLTGEHLGQLSVPLKTGLEVRQSGLWLEKLLFGKVQYTQLPMLYNGGFVNMSVLRQIESVSGSIYRSCAPDVYSAVAISSITDRYVYSHEPIAINGVSRHSTGKSSFSKKRNSKTSPVELFASEPNIPFHDDIPLCFDGMYPKSLHVIVYECYLQSSSLREDLRGDIHDEQLEVILATSYANRFEIEEWGKSFAEMHRLDFKKIRQKAILRKAALNVIRLNGQISNVMNTYRTDSRTGPIKDIYDASIIAAAIRSDMPSQIRRLRWLFERVIKKISNL